MSARQGERPQEGAALWRLDLGLQPPERREGGQLLKSPIRGAVVAARAETVADNTLGASDRKEGAGQSLGKPTARDAIQPQELPNSRPLWTKADIQD